MLLELEHLASRLIYTSWKKIKPSHPYGGENPVVERSLAKVLCLLCFATNDEDFIFCKKCGSHKEKTHLDQDPNTNKSPHTKRLLNTTATIDTQETTITAENNKFQQFRAARSTNIRSKNVLKSFEIFVHSRGLCKYSSLRLQPPFTILDAEDKDVVDFLMFKNVSSGKTWVHAKNCPYLGQRQKFPACQKLTCTSNHAADSLRTGIYQMLKQGFQDMGLNEPWNIASKTGNPVNSILVSEYLRMLRETQAKAGVTQKQAATLMRDETHKLIQSMIARLYRPNISFKETFELQRDLALITTAFATGKRGDDLGNLLVTQIISFPNIKGIICGFQFGKCLRDGNVNTFGILPDLTYPIMCPVRRIDKFMNFCKLHHLDMSGNHLFTNLIENGEQNTTRKMEKMSTDNMNARLRLHMHNANMKPNQGDQTFSLHSFRSGGPTSQLLEGKSLKRVMTTAYWKNPKTAMHYIKLLEVLGPFNYDQTSISPADYARLNNVPLQQSSNKLKCYPSTWFKNT